VRIFDPFYTRSPIGQGTGLGLSICYSIIQQHRGRIDVESEVGSGTCFCVHLPLAEPPCPLEGAVQSRRD
jgi:signal transduction histidine kinase